MGNIHTERGEISNNIIEYMINNILETVHTKSPLRGSLITLTSSIHTTTQNATWNATCFYAHACGTNGAKLPT